MFIFIRTHLCQKLGTAMSIYQNECIKPLAINPREWLTNVIARLSYYTVNKEKDKRAATQLLETEKLQRTLTRL